MAMNVLDIFLNHRLLTKYSGKDLTKFLQGVCTNDVHKLQKHGDCIAAAFLTPKVTIEYDC